LTVKRTGFKNTHILLKIKVEFLYLADSCSVSGGAIAGACPGPIFSLQGSIVGALLYSTIKTHITALNILKKKKSF
jgi:hypothetical protein